MSHSYIHNLGINRYKKASFELHEKHNQDAHKLKQFLINTMVLSVDDVL